MALMEPIIVEIKPDEAFLNTLTARIEEIVTKVLQEKIEAVRSESRAFTQEEAAEKLSISRTGLYLLIKNGKLKTVKNGRRVLIPESEIMQFLKQTA